MNETKTLLTDTIQATEGSAYITINGVNRELGEVSKLSAQLELTVKEKRMLGHRMPQHKIVGATGSGSVTLHFMRGDYSKIAMEYVKTGKYPVITIQVVNEDPQSTMGRNNIKLNNIIFKKALLAYLEEDTEDDITFDSDFTFDSADGLEYFK